MVEGTRTFVAAKEEKRGARNLFLHAETPRETLGKGRFARAEVAVQEKNNAAAQAAGEFRGKRPKRLRSGKAGGKAGRRRSPP